MRSPSLLVHVFLRADRVERPDAPDRPYLEALWAGCGRLGMNQTIPGRPEPLELPATLIAGSGSAVRVLAAREAPGAGVWQAFVFRTHDVVGLTALLAPSDGRGWRELDALWARHCPKPGQDVVPLGTVRLYRALAGGGVRRLSAAVRHSAPQHPADPAAVWSAPCAATRDGFLLWEQRGGPDARLHAHRRMAIVADRRAEARLDGWTWIEGEPGLTPLGRYLLHAAKLRYEARVYAAGARFRELRAEAEDVLDDLMRLHTQPSGRIEEFIAAAWGLARLRAGGEGLITALTRLRALRRTAEIAAANMTAAVGEECFRDAAGAFARDRRTAEWLTAQLDDDALYLQATTERAREIGSVTDGVVQRWQQQRQQQVVLLQTSVLGAVLMGLTVVQALQYHLPVPGPLQPSLIAVLAGAALSLPTAVLRWLRGSGEQAPLSAADMFSLSLFGGCLAWFVSAVVSYELGGRVLATGRTALLSVASGLATWAAGFLVLRRRRGSL